MNNLQYRSIDLMKWTKDLIYQQPTDATINKLVALLTNEFDLTHLAISVPMDTSGYDSTPSPRTVVQFTQAWADAIHGAGLGVLWRGAWCGLEAIYGFDSLVGEDRFPPGNASSTDTTTWIGKTYRYIVDNPTFFADGDIWGPCPEMTNVDGNRNVFVDEDSFISHSGGVTVNYAAFFNNLKTASEAAFTAIGKNVTCGLSSQIYSEVASGWVPDSVFDGPEVVTMDHYGTTHTPTEMDTDIRAIYTAREHPVFLQEWGDYWNGQLDPVDRLYYFKNMCTVLKTLASEGKLIGFNYWGAWLVYMGYDTLEGILYEPNGLAFNSDSANFQLTGRGKVLADFFNSEGYRRIPVADPEGNF